MKRAGKNEIKRYVVSRLVEEDLREVCSTIIFDDKYPGLMTVFEQDKRLVINLEKFYQTLNKEGIKNNLANLIIFHALEHEIAHLRQYRDVHRLGKRDDKNFAILKSLGYSNRISVADAISKYNTLYHEYEADASALSILLSDKEFLERGTFEEMCLFNKEMATRIMKRYRVDGKIYSPLALFIADAYGRHEYLSDDDYDKLLGFLYKETTEYESLIDGRDLNACTIDTLDGVSSGSIKSSNILKLIK